MPTLDQLPDPAPGKSGWPWTEGPVPLPDGGQAEIDEDLPRISIVTPSFQQVETLEQTIRSVLLQGYPRLEYFIVDGGSSDGSVEVIQKYEPWLDGWVSESDRGQSHAINKGFDLASGTLYGWLNSDDYLLPGALHALASLQQLFPSAVAWAGACHDVDGEGRFRQLQRPRVGSTRHFLNWWFDAYIVQPGCLFSAELFHRLGGLNERLHYVMDMELWARLAAEGPFATCPQVIACNRQYPGIKTFADPAAREAEQIGVAWQMEEPEIARAKLVQFAEHHFTDLSSSRLIWLAMRRFVSRQAVATFRFWHSVRGAWRSGMRQQGAGSPGAATERKAHQATTERRRVA